MIGVIKSDASGREISSVVMGLLQERLNYVEDVMKGVVQFRFLSSFNAMADHIYNQRNFLEDRIPPDEIKYLKMYIPKLEYPSDESDNSD